MRKCFNPWVGKILEKEMATHSSILAWRIPWTEGPEGYCVWSLRRVRHERVHMCVRAHTHTHMRTLNHRVNLTACQMIKTITQEVGRTQEGTQTVTKQYNCTIDECLNHTEGGGKKGGDLSHPGRGFCLEALRQQTETML